MNRKSMWDTLDKLEGRKDSSYAHLQKERVRQGYKPEASARSRAIKKLKVEDKSSPKEEHAFRMSKTVKRGVARFGK